MKYVYMAINWVFGVFFLLTGLFFLVELPLAGLCLIVAATLLLPPVRSFAYSKTNKVLPVTARAIAIFSLFLAFGVFGGQSQEKKAQELAAQQVAQLRQKNIVYFNANREQIISAVKKALSEKDYQSVISQSNKYLVAGDKELKQMNAQAKAEKLLAELKGVPAQEYEKNRSLYQQLLSLHPDNELYKTKVAFYAGKVEEEKQKQIAAEARKKKIESQFSAGYGSHRNLERVIKDSMNDPDSYDHAETVYWDRGDHLVVRTTFRGKNAFGGVVRNSVKAKVNLDGQVLQILDQD
jgi:hypothetical protein